MKRISVLGLVVMLVFIILAGCAPAAAPGPAPAPPKPAAAPAAPSSSTEEAAWEAVVAAARKEGKVVAYDHFLVGDIGLAVQRAFENRYGIKLELITASGAPALERVKTERRMGQITGDYVGTSSTWVTTFKREGLIDAVFDRLPELKDMTKFKTDLRELDPSGHLLGFDYNNYNAWMNTKLLRPEDAPKSLKDFLDPKWKKRILSRDPVLSSGEYTAWVPLLNRGIIDNAYLQALGDQELRFYHQARESGLSLARGDGLLHTMSSGSAFAPLIAEGAPIKAVPLEHGDVIYMSSLAPIKGAPHLNATLVYLNWRLSQEGQTVYARATGSASVRRDVPDFRHPNLISGAKVAFVITEKDLDDAGRGFLEKMLVPLLKR